MHRCCKCFYALIPNINQGHKAKLKLGIVLSCLGLLLAVLGPKVGSTVNCPSSFNCVVCCSQVFQDSFPERQRYCLITLIIDFLSSWFLLKSLVVPYNNNKLQSIAISWSLHLLTTFLMLNNAVHSQTYTTFTRTRSQSWPHHWLSFSLQFYCQYSFKIYSRPGIKQVAQLWQRDRASSAISRKCG